MPLQSLAESLFPLSQTLFSALSESPPQSPPHAQVPIRATRKLAQWKAGISQAYTYLSGRTHDPQEQGWLDQHYEKVMQDKPDFARVRRIRPAVGQIRHIDHDLRRANDQRVILEARVRSAD